MIQCLNAYIHTVRVDVIALILNSVACHCSTDYTLRLKEEEEEDKEEEEEEEEEEEKEDEKK